tara:strand:+ start:795 stop:989 length:195 start_codon:yes stop_codon:yes gene_type:complete
MIPVNPSKPSSLTNNWSTPRPRVLKLFTPVVEKFTSLKPSEFVSNKYHVASLITSLNSIVLACT